MSRVRFRAPHLLLPLFAAALFAAALLGGCRSAHTTSAILYIDQQEYEQAVEVIHEGFQYRDDEPDAFYYLGEAHSHIAEDAVAADDYREALEHYRLAYDAYQRALELDHSVWEEEVSNSLKYNYNNRLRQAKRDWDDGYFEQAEGHLRLAYAALPDSVTPVKSIARMKMQMSNEADFADRRDELLNEALTLLEQVLEDNPEAYELQLDKANVLAALGRNDEAKRIYNDLLAEHGDDTVLLGEIANLAINESDYARAADFYVRIVNLQEADTDASNDENNKDMLVAAGTWYSLPSIGRYEDAIDALDRAAEMEIFPTENVLLGRLRTYYQYGKEIKDEAETATDPARKAELQEKAGHLLNRAVDIGKAMTDSYVANPEGFLYLSSAQFELGDFSAAEANLKTYEELSAAGG